MTVLPCVLSLRALRRFANVARAGQPSTGFGDIGEHHNYFENNVWCPRYLHARQRNSDRYFGSQIEIMAKDLPEHFTHQIEWGKKFSEDSRDIERFLIEFEKTGRSASLVVEASEFRRKQRDERKSP